MGSRRVSVSEGSLDAWHETQLCYSDMNNKLLISTFQVYHASFKIYIAMDINLGKINIFHRSDILNNIKKSCL